MLEPSEDLIPRLLLASSASHVMKSLNGPAACKWQTPCSVQSLHLAVKGEASLTDQL